MLYGYPIAATANNWLHDCLCDAVRAVHALVDAKKRYPAWPGIIPAAHQAALRPKTGLRDRLYKYASALRRLDAAQRARVLGALTAQNRIADLLSGACECETVGDLAADVRGPIDDLFTFAFGLLTDVGLRAEHYRTIYRASRDRTCPFCGAEYFDAPGGPQEPLDHYLARSSYPFAAANLRNLVPMGSKCNSTYKRARDLLRTDGGARRVAVDPYAHAGLEVSLDNSQPFDGTTEHTPLWRIEFTVAGPAIDTWDEVFKVRERYRRDHLDPSYDDWLGYFAKFARDENADPDSPQDIIAVLRRLEDLSAFDRYKDRAFLKLAVYRMLRRHCEAGHARLLALLGDAVRVA